jgi:hypothetical protein
MKFELLDINLFLLKKNIENFEGTFNFESGKDIKINIKLSDFAIGVTHRHELGQLKLENLWKCYVAKSGEYESVINETIYQTSIYDILPNTVENDHVYIYYKFNRMSGGYDETINTISTNNTNKPIAFEENEHMFLLYNNSLYYTKLKKGVYYPMEQYEVYLKEFVYKTDKKFNDTKKQIELYEKLLKQDDETTRKRMVIPEEVKFEVWRRDEGKCVICGSKANLEFDHIIPFSKGGSNTARNLQLLCENCNRKKAAKI